MIKPEDPILIAGAGSIGERHIRNLWISGYKNLHVFRQRNLPFRNIESAKVQVFTEWNKIDSIKPKVAFITSPTSFHIEQTIACASKGIHVFVEKPLSHSSENIDKLKEVVIQTGVFVQVGYMMRFHPMILKIKAAIDKHIYGKLLSFHTHWGEYLPDWHPWEDYRISYAAKKELGGGAALTLSHDIDLVNWLQGCSLVYYKGIPNFTSSLQVDVNSGADFLFKYDNGVTGHVHLNFFEKVSRRLYSFIFEDGILDFDYFKAELKISTKEKTVIEVLEKFDRNNLFIDQTKKFFENIEKYSVEDSLNNIKESEKIIRICESCA